MESARPATRLAQIFRWPIVLVSAACGLVVAADMTVTRIAPEALFGGAAAVAAAGVILFLTAVLDMRFQRAVSALNAELRAEARKRGGLSRLGVGFRSIDPLLMALMLLLLLVVWFCGALHRAPDAALGAAALWLLGCAQVAGAARGYPTDKFVPPFA
jgi:hypothetical protein